MTLNKAINIFKNLIAGSNERSEIKVYEDFIIILNNLKNRDFSEEEKVKIEATLKSFNLESNQQQEIKHIKKRLKEFKRFLKNSFSLVSRNYYTNLYITYGAGFGAILGIIIGERFEKSLGMALGIGIGMLMGSILGKSKDANAKGDGKVLE